MRLGEREDALPGFIELSDGSIHFGRVYMTRDKRFKIYDSKLQRQREIPLAKIRQIECKVDKEWEEREWRFKELAKDEKLYTGRSYPAREYSCVVTLRGRADDRRHHYELAVVRAAGRNRRTAARRGPAAKRSRSAISCTIATRAKWGRRSSNSCT